MTPPPPEPTPRNRLVIPQQSSTEQTALPTPSPKNAAKEEAERVRLIKSHTLVRSVPLLPDLRLHLITEDSPLWLANEEQAREAGFDLPFWAFAWPGGQALARHIQENPELVRGKRVLDFGSGSAIEGLAALRAGAAEVLAADIDPFACTAAQLNAELNQISGLSTTSEDLVGQYVDVDLLLAGDVFYDPDFATRCLTWLQELAEKGTTILIGDPSRGFLDTSSLSQVASYPATHDGELDPSQVRLTGVYSLGR